MSEQYHCGIGKCDGLVKFEMVGDVARATSAGCLFEMVGDIKRFSFNKTGISRRTFRAQVKRMIRNTRESEKVLYGA
jgi:hypothetical protein